MNVIDYITITCNQIKVWLQITFDYMKKCNRLQLITITITITPCLTWSNHDRTATRRTSHRLWRNHERTISRRSTTRPRSQSITITRRTTWRGIYSSNPRPRRSRNITEGALPEPEALKSLYRSPGNKKKQLVLCKNYVLQW
jgi:hypothetical protein